MTAKLMIEPISAVGTPGRRTISRSGAAGPEGCAPGTAARIASPIVFGSGRTPNESTRPAKHEDPGRRATARRGLRASARGRRTVDRDERPEDRGRDCAEENERDAARAPLRSEHLRRRGPREKHDRTPRPPSARSQTITNVARLDRAAEPPSRARPGSRARSRPRITGIRPTRSPSPAGREDGDRPAEQVDRRPEPENPLDPGDRDERHGRKGDEELDRPPFRQTSPPASKTAFRVTGKPCIDLSNHGAQPVPERRRASTRRDGGRTGPERGRGHASDRDRRTCRCARPARERQAGRDLERASACGSTSPCRDGSGRRSRAGRRRRPPSSTSVLWTIVALASAGPAPVTCRSDVNGSPETRAPR